MKSKYLYCFDKENFVNVHSNHHCYDYMCHKGTISNKKTAYCVSLRRFLY